MVLSGIWSEQPAADAHGQHALEHITKGGKCRCLFTEGAQHIGHACSAAAVLAYVIVIQELADEDTGVDAAQQIRLHSGHHSDENRFHHLSLPDVLYVLGTHFAGAALPHDQTDGRMLQTKVFADLIDEIPLIAEVEQVLCVHEGHERGGRVEACVR